MQIDMALICRARELRRLDRGVLSPALPEALLLQRRVEGVLVDLLISVQLRLVQSLLRQFTLLLHLVEHRGIERAPPQKA